MSDLDEGLEPSSAEEQTDYLNMSDDDVLNMPFPDEEELTFDEAPAEEEEEAIDESELDTEELSDEDVDDEDDTSTEEEELETETETEETLEEVVEDNSGDFKTKYESLMAPLRANGKDVVLKTEDDLRRLAQMGIGYNASMAAIKPLRKIGKMLENAGLLEESKINYLIDLSKNDPNAINKLVKESGINPLDIEPENSEGYKPNTYTVDDSQLDLDEAITELEQSPSGQRVIDVVSNKWDRASKEILVSNPAMMRDLQSHVDSGIYEKVMAEVEREKLFKRIPAGVSDIDAYNYIGNQMKTAGLFEQAGVPSTKAKPVNVIKDTKRKTRRKAAASTRSKPTSNQAPQDILNMSDADFEKNLMSKYI